ncbi:unnamed protein product [Calypogeia fissa]
MRKLWERVFIALLLCQLARGFVCAEETLFNLEGDLGVDMCPECRPLPPLNVARTFESLHDEDLGVDMCPEKGQPMSDGGKRPGPILETEANTLVKDLQQLVKAQQLQIDQVGDLLRELAKTRSREDLGVLNVPDEETLRNTDSTGRFTHDEFPEHEHNEDVSPTKGEVNAGYAQRENGVVHVDGEGQRKGIGGGMLVVPYRPSWSEHFSFLSAVKVDGEVSSIHVLPQEGSDGETRYVVGDMKGELYIFLWFGDLLLHYPTISTAPITSMLSYTLQKTETILVTGHADGGVLVHQIRDPMEPGSGSKDGRAKLSSIKTLHSLKAPSPESVRANIGKRDDGDGGTEDRMYRREASESVVDLELFKVGKMRYTVVVDKSGKIQLFRDNGTLHGVAQAPSQPLAFMRNPNAQRLVFLTQNGVGTLDIRSMQVRSNFCVDLNSSTVMAYAFDAVGRSRANGFTTEGDLVSVVLKGEMTTFECHVKKKRQLGIEGPFAPLALKGYLVAATPDHVLVFNTTSQTGFNYANFWVEGPRLIFSVPLKEIVLSFLKTPISQSPWPVVASNRNRIVVLGFSGGYVGVFRSHLPMKPPDFSAKFSNTSILISGLVLLAMWQLMNRKRGAVNTPVQSSSTPGDEKADSGRLGLRDREKVAEPRRFKSPTRGYVVANPTPFGSSSRNFVLSGKDTYSSRREPLFSSNQPVGELEPRQ